MTQGGKIIVPSDFSASSRSAFKQAIELAKLRGAEVHLLHVLEPAFFYESDMMAPLPMDEVTESMRKAASAKLKEQAKLAPEGVKIFADLEETMQEPDHAICRIAKEIGADLIVIGRHGHKGFLEHLLIGSTAERVARHAPCAVLITMPERE